MIDVYVVAQRQLKSDDFDKISLWNNLLTLGYDPPKELEVDLLNILGNNSEIEDKEIIPTPDNQKVIEIGIRGAGDILTEGGMTIPVSAFPPDTVAIRIYAKP